MSCPSKDTGPPPKVGYLAEIIRGSIIGTIDLSIEILRGASVQPRAIFFAPSFFGENLRLIKEKRELMTFAQAFRNYPYRVIGAAGMGLLCGYHTIRIYEFLRDNPAYLVIPLMTNILSTGYQRYRKNKETTLEERIS